jgi:Na+/proline symporter
LSAVDLPGHAIARRLDSSFATALVISVVTQLPVTWAIVIIGVAMIIYTVRGGASAVIWTDVVQLFVYVAGAAVVFFSLLALIPGGWSEVARPAPRPASSAYSTSTSCCRDPTRSGPGSSAAWR